EAIVARCMAKLPAQRFADTRELAAELAALAQFSAATSVVAPIQDPSASGSRPMGYAGRPPPKSPRELTNSYKPVNQPIHEVIDDTPDERPAAPRPAPPASGSTGMSAPAIVAATLAGVIAVAGFGVGMYWLVNRLIDEHESAERREPPTEARPAEAEGARPSDAKSSEARPAPASPAAPAEPAPAESAAAPAQPQPDASAPASAEPRAKKPASKGSHKQAQPSEPAPTPAEEHTPKPAKPKKTKPSVEPDSKAKDQIGHDDLRDPWG